MATKTGFKDGVGSSHASPFAFAHKDMFGWGKEDTEDPSVEIVTYDTRPETLKACILRVKLPDALWRMISAFLIPTPITFELWKLAEYTYANWYGQMSYGTCWFRGCKIWLTPAAGLTMQLVWHRKDLEMSSANFHRAWTERRTQLEWNTHSRARASIQDDANAGTKYDTSRFPFRLAEPTELFDAASRASMDAAVSKDTLVPDIFDKIAPSYDASDYEEEHFACERHHAAYTLSRLAPDEATIYTYPTTNHLDIVNPAAGGDPEVVVLRNQKVLCNELSWIQDIGAKKHNIRFIWV